MTLHEYTKAKKQQLAAFEKTWVVQQSVYPETYPEQMGFAEWDEQLAVLSEV